ncbi:OadG family protein [Teredinibacter sp. KSP-S5-2]|uniref:OadG family protein n=1 Tax=Teredinibacter sp. KSP-S5-2 TaxID=3034506 RepID=UPI0029348EEA|nr:OadG family protein [Teredinibacter sp. KSP-S5-2]WNO10089.1 OadG family protein [Teredinibacter sp. KSP-S5-2]
MQETLSTTSLVSNGMDLMIYGMGTVFVFLTLLVIATLAMSYIVGNYFAESPEEVSAKPAGNISPRTLAVIQAAVQEHRAKHK